MCATQKFYMVGLQSSSLRPGEMHKYLTMTDTASTPRYVVFQKKSDAKACVRYLASHKHFTGEWPAIDLASTSPRVVKHLPKSKRHHTIETLTRDFLWIYDYDRSDIDWHAMRAGVQYVWISSWVHLPNMEHKNVSQLSFRGQEIDGVADRACYNANLEAIYLESN